MHNDLSLSGNRFPGAALQSLSLSIVIDGVPTIPRAATARLLNSSVQVAGQSPAVPTTRAPDSDARPARVRVLLECGERDVETDDGVTRAALQWTWGRPYADAVACGAKRTKVCVRRRGPTADGRLTCRKQDKAHRPPAEGL
jgi:hypothetical protein